MGLIGKQAPEIETKAAVKELTIDFSLDDYKGKYVLLFFYPMDFTFVCPTELHAFEDKYEEFKHLDCEVVGCSTDSVYTHLAWLRTPKSEGGIEGISYPLIADKTMTVSRSYDVLKEEEGIAYRGLFLIDRQGMIRHQLINDLPLGRSVDEALRMLKSLLHFEEIGEVCPANWMAGDKAMNATFDGVKNYFSD